jgi:hypothetical protein
VANATKEAKLVELPRASITRDKRLQMRKRLRSETVERYAEVLQDGVTMPAAVVFYDGKKHWLADGWHRDAAAEKAGLGVLYCEVRKGGFRDAWKFALGANGDNGLPRDSDTLEAVMRSALSDEEVRGFTDGRIAILCNVSPVTVGRWRKRLETDGTITPVIVRTGSDGRKTDVSRIGRPTSPPSVEPTPSANGHTNGHRPDFLDEPEPLPVAEPEPEPENGRAKALAAYKAAEKALGAIQDNLLLAKRSGGRHPNPEGYAKGFFEIIQKGRASL